MIQVKFVIYNDKILISKRYNNTLENLKESSNELFYQCHGMDELGMIRYYDEITYISGDGADYVKCFIKEANADHYYNLNNCQFFSIERKPC